MVQRLVAYTTSATGQQLERSRAVVGVYLLGIAVNGFVRAEIRGQVIRVSYVQVDDCAINCLI